jgi:hypothetical protein
MRKKPFFELWHPKDINQKYLALWSDDMRLKPIICPKDEGHGRTGNRLTELKVVIEDKRAFNYDIIWTWYSEALVSDKVINIITSEGLTGYTLKPVTIEKIRKTSPEIIPDYRELSISGIGGDVHPDSGIIIGETCEICNLKGYTSWKGPLILDQKNWDGSDFFRFTFPGGIFVTKKVKEAFEKYQVSNVTFIPLEEVKDV